MTKDKKSTVQNTSRLFTVTVNEYCNHCMKGVLYQGGVAPGTRYRSFMEMILQMDLIFDRMACPMQTMTVRRFTGTTVTVPKLEPQERFETGKFAAFQIYVRYRYNASWQGDIIWQNGLNSRHFESVLQLIQLIDEILTGKYTVSKKNRNLQSLSNSCRVFRKRTFDRKCSECLCQLYRTVQRCDWHGLCNGAAD